MFLTLRDAPKLVWEKTWLNQAHRLNLTCLCFIVTRIHTFVYVLFAAFMLYFEAVMRECLG